jgi:hypothetical protein
MKKGLLTAGALAIVGIGMLMADVKTDYDHKADFGSYKTYSWLKVDAGDSLWADRIKSAVDEQLSAKGWTNQASGGSVGITGMGRVTEEQTYTTFYDGLGGGWGWRRFGGIGMETATTNVEETPVGTLTIDMFDASTKKLIWRGTATATLSSKPDKNDKKLEKGVADMFKKFPPKGES